jgi:predicted nucleic acid-binding protein
MRFGPVIANNTPLVAFWSISRLEILQNLFDEILIPPAIRDEFLSAATGNRFESLQAAQWIKLTPLSRPNAADAFAGLDRGEAEVIALAQEQDARLVLLDERRARRYAIRMGLPVSGTLGVLLLAKQEGLIEAVKPLISSLIESGLHVHQDLAEEVLQLAGE